MSEKKLNPSRIILSNVRLSYVNLLHPKTTIDDKGKESCKYSVQVHLPKTDKKGVALLDMAIKFAIDSNKAALANKNGVIPSSMKRPKRDGDTDEAYMGDPIYKGVWVINASNKKKPGIVDRYNNAIANEEMVYSGVYANISLTIAAFTQEGKGIGAYVNNVQIIKDGERLDGTMAPQDEFMAYDDDAEV
jgi:hypothetical protein